MAGEIDPGIIPNKDLALLYTHNLSKTAAIRNIKFTLSSPAESFNFGPVASLSVYSTTHTPSVTPKWSITVTIPQGNTFTLTVPAGTANLSFKISNKTTYGIQLPFSLRDKETIAVNYMDSFENTAGLPPPGKSSILIDNQSTYTATAVEIYRADMQTVGGLELLNWEPAGPIGPGHSASKIVNNQATVVIQVMVTNGTNSLVISRQAILTDTVVLIAITKVDVEDGDNGFIIDPLDPEPTGGFRMFNQYSGIGDMKIFKFILTPTIPPDNPTYTWNDGINNNPIRKGDSDNIATIEPGYYNLTIVAGIYNWGVYYQGEVINDITYNEETITYNGGSILITANTERQYYFDNRNREKDIPHGLITVYVTYSGLTPGADGSHYHPMSRLDIVTRPEIKWGSHASSWTYVEADQIPGESKILRPPMSVATWQGQPVPFPHEGDWEGWSDTTKLRGIDYASWPGTWISADAGPYPNENRLVLKVAQTVSYGQTIGPFYMPPGKYFMRYYDTYAEGRAIGYGSAYPGLTGTTHWQAKDLSGYGRRTITIVIDPSSGVIIQ